jgi:hypothetical protein
MTQLSCSWGIHHTVLRRSTDGLTTSGGSQHDPLLLFSLSTGLHGSLLVNGSSYQIIVGQVGEQVQAVLQLDSEPLAEELTFLCIQVDVVRPVLG